MNLLRRIFFFLLFPLVLVPATAQSTGERMTGAVSIDLPHRLTLKVTGGARFLNTGIGLYKYLIEVEGGYKINKYLDVALIYRTAWRLEENGGYYFRNKLMADLSADKSFDRFRLANRLRYQRRTKSYRNDAWDVVTLQHLRDKVSLSYNIPKCRITPVLFGEMFFPLYPFRTRTVDEVRLGLDLKYKINKQHAVKGGVMVQNGIVGLPLTATWFRMGYVYKWKW